MTTVLDLLQADLDQASKRADEATDFDEWMDALDAWVDDWDAMNARMVELGLDASLDGCVPDYMVSDGMDALFVF